MSILNFDCMSVLLEYICIENLIDTCLQFAYKQDIKQLIHNRKSPVKFFSDLVADPHELLYYMAAYRCILGGSRVVDYFRPGSCTEESDWDFYIELGLGDDNYVHSSMKQSLEYMGVKWNTGDSYDYIGLDLSVLRGEMTQGRGKGQKVQLISTINRLLLPTVVSFHSTPVQCIMTHFGAFHLYGKQIAASLQRVWSSNVESRFKEITRRNARYCEVERSKHSMMRTLALTSPVRVESRVIVAVAYIRQQLSIYRQRLYDETIGVDDPGFIDHIVTLTQTDHAMGSTDRPNDICELIGHAIVVRMYMESDCTCIATNELSAIVKYRDRGFKRDASDMQLSVPGYKTTKHSHIDYHIRSIGDSYSTIVPFYGYNSAYSDKVIHRHMLQICKFKWFEFDRRTTCNCIYSYLDVIEKYGTEMSVDDADRYIDRLVKQALGSD